MRPFTRLAILLLALIAIIQLTRVILGWQVLVGSTAIPIWASLIASVVAGGLALMVWREHAH